MLEHKPPDSFDKWTWVLRSGSLAALGRIDESSASVRETLSRYPDLTVEGMVNDRRSKTERDRLIETMRLAKFPLCAKPEELAKMQEPVRLPECV
jgi:hypothetical protein